MRSVIPAHGSRPIDETWRSSVLMITAAGWAMVAAVAVHADDAHAGSPLDEALKSMTFVIA